MSNNFRSVLWLTIVTIVIVPFFGAIADDTATQHKVLEIEKANNASLLWGPYRPNLYFGIRPRIPKSLMTGVLWARVEDYQSVQHSEKHSILTLMHCH
jgi:mannosyl-oligosaccharide glucosidase